MPIRTHATWSGPFEPTPAVAARTNKIPDVSIVIVNWNRLDEVLKTLQYLNYQGGVHFEVVLVDNGSTDGSAERLARVEGIKFVGLGTNVGPCKARNIGIEHARGRYILFLDSDAILSKWSLPRLVERMDQDSTIGILACTIINGATRRLDGWIHIESSSTRRRHEFDTYSFSAAGAMVRLQALHDAGPFWDELFIYNEEVDLSIRVIRAGYRVVHYPKVRVYHFPSIHGRKEPGAYWRFQIRNWIWIFYRYYPSGSRLSKIISYIGVYILKAIFNHQVRACLSGILEGLTKTEIIDRYPDKLSPMEVRRIGALNVKTRFRLDR
jgi:GT2 family glycosyltransferase